MVLLIFAAVLIGWILMYGRLPTPQALPPPLVHINSADDAWRRLAGGKLVSEYDLQRFFEDRQKTSGSTDARLKIDNCVKVTNPKLLDKFRSSGSLHDDPRLALHHGDTFLFHGCSQMALTNIQLVGLQKNRAGAAHGTMLGHGIYGAPDPRKSNQYNGSGSPDGRFMIVMRVNLANRDTKYAHNSIYDEYCVFDDCNTVPLWAIKLQGASSLSA